MKGETRLWSITRQKLKVRISREEKKIIKKRRGQKKLNKGD